MPYVSSANLNKLHHCVCVPHKSNVYCGIIFIHEPIFMGSQNFLSSWEHNFVGRKFYFVNKY